MTLILSLKKMHSMRFLNWRLNVKLVPAVSVLLLKNAWWTLCLKCRLSTTACFKGSDSMKINPSNVDIITSAVSPEQYPETGLKEIALSGRSNVGKSSFINAMCGRKGVARTSSKPGKTITLNFYNADNK